MVVESTDTGGLLYTFTNDSDRHKDVQYASLTAPGVVRCEIRINDEPWDIVYAGNGGSHSWWTSGGGKLLPPQGLPPGATLTVQVDGRSAFRIDWMD